MGVLAHPEKGKKKFKLRCEPRIEKWGKNVENLHPQASPTKKNWQKSIWGDQRIHEKEKKN